MDTMLKHSIHAASSMSLQTSEEVRGENDLLLQKSLMKMMNGIRISFTKITLSQVDLCCSNVMESPKRERTALDIQAIVKNYHNNNIFSNIGRS